MVFNHITQPTQSRLNDNLLVIFRYASIIRVVISVLLWLVISSQIEEQRLGHLLTIIDASLLTIYLFATPLQMLFKDNYLPIALSWATITPLLTSTVTMFLFYTTPIPDGLQVQMGLVENFVIFYNVGITLPILLIPLLIVSWLYTRQLVGIYLLSITLFDAVIISLFVPLGNRILIAVVLISFRLIILASDKVFTCGCIIT
ncbi:MAG: hypothetical protein AAFV93_19625 [Chloroflexota bacterium]